MLEFTAQDFEHENMGKLTEGKAANLANAKFKEWAENGVEVWCTEAGYVSGIWSTVPTEQDKRCALLIDIKHIEAECEHESVSTWNFTEGTQYSCSRCHKKLRPTGWQEISE